MHGYLPNNGAQRAALLIQRLLSKNRFTRFGTRCLFRRLIGASLRKCNRKNMPMQRAYSCANKSFTRALSRSIREIFDLYQ
ncbi:hypothetical protein CES85_0300 [Ochrobactrum quorumnocens]|uniref:Uncharacterized protein n=1 Tax=Ochrobactrum quorumnocens TaxID=271865 RepID=A0A248UFF6_9HYPH|nr:hypothetical protein CES85_0300 [[Ochrobactrum] quorumnocens]